MHSLFEYQKAISMPESRLYINIYICWKLEASISKDSVSTAVENHKESLKHLVINKQAQLPSSQKHTSPIFDWWFQPIRKKHVIGDHHPKYG